MKITIERGALLKSLNHVQSVVERRNTIPILSNVLIRADQGQLSFTATDLDIEVVEAVDADVAQPGGTTAPAHTLYDIVRKLPDGAQVELTYGADEGRLTLQAGRSRFALQCLPQEDFPAMSAGELPHRFDLPGDALARLLDKTRFAISTEETRYYLNGIYLHTVEEGAPMLRAVATDGHRLAQADYPLPDGAAGMPGIIVPRKTVQELQKLAEGHDGLIHVSVSDTKIRFEFNGIVLTSKLIDGTFPDYERVIPKDNDKLLEVEGKRFAQAVDRVSTISTEKSRAVKMQLEEGRLTLSVNNPDSGSAVEELAVSYAADPIEIGFNARYLLDIAAQLDGDQAIFAMADSGSPTLIRDGDDKSAIYVLMPMRV
ncbi:DNA polymerase III subunit beta [Tepidicaulis sp. LMO-SS28]|uniref:DNA polymerase III subunit beta n=1 Tax=Tepidicaulis sp. LMO-SS28 TaxID=3447455 RepID=UPI003EDEBCB8